MLDQQRPDDTTSISNQQIITGTQCTYCAMVSGGGSDSCIQIKTEVSASWLQEKSMSE